MTKSLTPLGDDSYVEPRGAPSHDFRGWSLPKKVPLDAPTRRRSG
jgi:hypothetical protein